MPRIVLAECRRLVLFFPFGVSLWLIVAFLIYRDFDRYGCCPTYDPDRLLVTSKLFFLTLIYGLGPAVGWAQGGMYGRPASEACTFRLTETLPFSLFQLNLTRILTGVAFMALSAGTWLVTFALWRHFNYPTPAWVAVFAALAILSFQLVGLRHKILRYVLPVPVPLLFFPGAENVLSLEWLRTPWPSLLLAALVTGYGGWALRQPPPHWAR